MICYALGTRFGESPFQWLIPSRKFTSFFAQKAVDSHKEEIIDYCQNLEPNETHGIQKDGYYFYLKRLGSDYCVIVVDTLLNEKQINYLSWYLLRLKLPMSDVAPDIEKYTKDHKVEEIKAKVAETQQIMLDNLEKLELRGEGIKNLVEKSENLATSSFHFKQKSEELNSCWPKCNLI